MVAILPDPSDFEFMANTVMIGSRASELVVELNAREAAQQDTSILLMDKLTR